jgi:MFS family permease
MKSNSFVLVIIVFSQFCCTSLWFAGNGVLPSLVTTFDLQPSALSHLTSSVQLGFITGTLFFALLSLADRISPSKLFFVSAQLGALANLLTLFEGNSLLSLMGIRFLTGFFLAGIYPVGMKIASDYFKTGLGLSLGFLVGALVLGTAFPHLLNSLTHSISWIYVLVVVSVLASAGGFFMLVLVPDGPFHRAASKLDLSASLRVFKSIPFRRAAFGYFGHMWELYTFWAFTPLLFQTHMTLNGSAYNVPLVSFVVISSGALSCVIGGLLSKRFGAETVALSSLFLSGLCCLLSPVVLLNSSGLGFTIFMMLWGMTVIADSPLFSTLVAKNCPQDIKGTSLTVVNCIGFSITILSIQWIGQLMTIVPTAFTFLVLSIGPIFGLVYAKFNKEK